MSTKRTAPHLRLLPPPRPPVRVVAAVPRWWETCLGTLVTHGDYAVTALLVLAALAVVRWWGGL